MSASDQYDITASSLPTSTGHGVNNMSKVILQQEELAAMCKNRSTNQSMTFDPRCDRSGPSITLTTPIVMLTTGVLGNILALAIIYTSRRESHARRTVFFVMLSGLAWTDLLGQLSVGPVPIVMYANNLRWVGGDHLCRYHGFMMTSIGLVTPLIVCCMSVERFLAIRFSYYYARHVTRRKAFMTFVCCWGGTIIFSSLPFIGFGSYEQQFPGTWCFLNFHRESTLDSIYAGLFSCLNMISIFIMIFCNAMVVGTLCMMRRSRQVNSSPSLEPRLSVSQISCNGTVIRPRRHSDMEAQMIWFLCLITTAFTVCWLPFNGHILGIQITGKDNQALDLLFVRMVGSNQILDPWLYVIFRKSSFLRLVRRLKSWFFPRSKEAILEEAMRQKNLRRPGRSRSYTVEVTTVDRTMRGGMSSPGRNWCVRNDQDDLEALKRILENEKKRPASSDKPSPSDRRSFDSASCLDGFGHGMSEDATTAVLNKAKLNLTVSLGISPSQSIDPVSSSDAQDEQISPEKQPLYVISNADTDEVILDRETTNLGVDDDLKQRLVPKLSYRVSNISCSSNSSEKESTDLIPRGLCLPSVSDERYSPVSPPRNSVSHVENKTNYGHSLSNGHVSHEDSEARLDSKPPKQRTPSASDINNLEFIDDVFDSSIDDSTMLYPPHMHQTKPRAQYQSISTELL